MSGFHRETFVVAQDGRCYVLTESDGGPLGPVLLRAWYPVTARTFDQKSPAHGAPAIPTGSGYYSVRGQTVMLAHGGRTVPAYAAQVDLPRPSGRTVVWDATGNWVKVTQRGRTKLGIAVEPRGTWPLCPVASGADKVNGWE